MPWILIIFLSLVLSSCSFAPAYKRPAMEIPKEYKETGPWVLANPNAAEVKNIKWWEMYDDPSLSKLEEELILANPDLKAAMARFDQGRSIASVAFAGLFPTINALGNPNRQQTSQTVSNPNSTSLYTDLAFAIGLQYEIDIWGKYRNTFYSSESEAKASAADYASLNLILQADLATYYFSLRATDLLQRVLDDNVIAYERALFIYTKLFEGGGAPIATYYEAQTAVEKARTLATEIRLVRSQFEHAIAVLVGKVPADFTLSPYKKYPQPLIAVQPFLPSTLLERRPDIAAAELRVQAANYKIGVTRAAFFPSLTLSADIGVESSKLAELFKRPSLIWSLGPTSGGSSIVSENANTPINQVLIDFGRIGSLDALAWATYYEQVANYQQTVLNAYQEVEDGLVAMHRLTEENITQSSATDFAYKTADQSVYRHKGGLVTYLEVAASLEAAYEVEVTAINIRMRHQIATVHLIRALGGGWTEEDLMPLDLKFRLL